MMVHAYAGANFVGLKLVNPIPVLYISHKQNSHGYYININWFDSSISFI